jgi:hypothetical protein
MGRRHCAGLTFVVDLKSPADSDEASSRNARWITEGSIRAI